MIRRLMPVAAGAVSLLATGGLLLAGTGVASAATPYTFEPDPNSVGTLTFYDASGHVVTGGSIPNNINTPEEISAYVVGSTPVHAGDSKATLYFATPSSANSATWSKSPVNGSTTYVPALSGLPAPLAGSNLPVFVGSNDPNTGDDSLYDYSDPSDGIPAATTGTNANIYQVRLYTNGPGVSPGSTYDSADVYVNRTTDTWTLVYPTVATTTTTLTSNTATQTAGTPTSLHAVISSASVPGTVTFFDGATKIGSPVTVANGASDSSSFSPTAGARSYTARFDPTPGYSDGSATTGTLNEYQDSTSTPLAVTVAPAATTPPVSLPEAPYAVLLLLTGVGAVGAVALARQRRVS